LKKVKNYDISLLFDIDNPEKKKKKKKKKKKVWGDIIER
jgi:hypothetical protein